MRDGMANWPFIYGCAWFSTCSETVFICDSCHLFCLIYCTRWASPLVITEFYLYLSMGCGMKLLFFRVLVG